MTEDFKDIIGKIDQLIDLAATDPKIEKSLKLRFIKLLLSLKLGFFKFAAEKTAEVPVVERKQIVRRPGKREKTEKKEESILKFIKEKGGQVGMVDFVVLGMSGRSLRRYLNSLRQRKLIKVEKRGREHFFKLI